MFTAVAALLSGLVLLTGGAYGLVRGASALALRFGVSPLLVGLTVVALGTSAPELVVSVQAALQGAGGIAVGNIVGSNIANVGLILGIAALIRPIRANRAVIRRDGIIMIGASLLVAGLLLDGRLGRPEGALLLLGLVAYLAWSLRTALRERVRAEDELEVSLPADSLGQSLGAAVVGLFVLVLGARLLVDGAVTVAQALGVSNAVIGLTVVAVGTSLPELATSLVAAARGESDIAVGNVIGSNTFNLLGILGMAALTQPLHAPGLASTDLAVMLSLGGGGVLFLATGARLSRLEGIGLLLVYTGYTGLLALAA
ncbi:MAG: calcium/sodium antiporter [Rhodothermaceae bacterium]|nr:calcium/sodium antiporter [Rhodothermaceae bacterium]